MERASIVEGASIACPSGCVHEVVGHRQEEWRALVSRSNAAAENAADHHVGLGWRHGTRRFTSRAARLKGRDELGGHIVAGTTVERGLRR